MRSSKFLIAGPLACLILAGSAMSAGASCVTKGAKATSYSENSAKWFVMETIVQQVSWGLWPGWVASGQLPGYKVKNKRYKCTKESTATTCIGQATICKAG